MLGAFGSLGSNDSTLISPTSKQNARSGAIIFCRVIDSNHIWECRWELSICFEIVLTTRLRMGLPDPVSLASPPISACRRHMPEIRFPDPSRDLAVHGLSTPNEHALPPQQFRQLERQYGIKEWKPDANGLSFRRSLPPDVNLDLASPDRFGDQFDPCADAAGIEAADRSCNSTHRAFSCSGSSASSSDRLNDHTL